ncbi:MRG/MORF4L-binding protein [Teleopsis dalmanni]|uniref:MRG/MORF4L-binding protein n=1 Tax=Teleopsis dalmanni TaxID=139649 RepID=UPI0018CEDC29|nr:MRG/MORF4L-binding protein [Teleopsis dalmanni]
MSTVKERVNAPGNSTQDLNEWTTEDEVQLILALADLKPVGINKHFYMAVIAERLSNALNREIPTESIWSHLHTLYNLEMLDELESLPFPNEEQEFSLPEDEYGLLISKKKEESEEKRLCFDVPAINRPSIIAVATDNGSKEKSSPKPIVTQTIKDLDKKFTTKLLEVPKRSMKRTRGSSSFESISPSTTPPPVNNSKRRRI